MKTLTQYESGELRDVIFIVEESPTKLSGMGFFPVGGDGNTWIKLLPMVSGLDMTALDEELQMLLADIRRVKGGRKTLRFALNHEGADVRLSAGYLAALASAKCGIELAVVPAEARAEIAARKNAKSFEPFA